MDIQQEVAAPDEYDSHLLPSPDEVMPEPNTGDESELGIPAMPSQVTAIIRTVSPYIVGWLLSGLIWLLTVVGLDITLPPTVETWLTSVVPFVLGSLYYILAKWLERKFPTIPWLGSTKKPLYTEPGVNVADHQGQIATLLAQPYVWFRGKKSCNCLVQAIPIAEKGLRALGVIKKDLTGMISQGSYNTSVAQSAGTHSGGGTWDVTWSLVNSDAKKRAWFNAGIIPFERTKADSVNWNNHGHLVVVGCPHRARSAVAQELAAKRGENALSNRGPFRGWRPSTIIAWSTAVRMQQAAKAAPKIPRVYTPKPWPWIATDGVLGAKTLNRLRMQLSVAVTGIPKLMHYDVAALLVWLGEPYVGSGILTKEAVYKLQYRVGAKQDGDWGPATTAALQKYLNRNR